MGKIRCHPAGFGALRGAERLPGGGVSVRHGGAARRGSRLPLRLREHHRSVSAAIRPTLCVVAADPRHTISRNPPVGNVGILLSARESITGVPRLKDATPLVLVV
ncbi:60S ribosomal protein L37 isoform X1 [Chelonia mydas]|uniref:60S ribosomal protein L37 isoform X1 n=1 Tax=Chelonia mydas TaxID=8469 RepID=UPI001CA8078B|nr:60S ribosomal protein L37 isoform X1 [Chelonia mydas]